MSSPAHPDLGDTIELMRKAHEGQMDKSGRPYYLHPMRVAMRLMQCSGVERHAALLHDVVEDTSVTLSDLRVLGYSEEIVELVDLLSRRKDQGKRIANISNVSCRAAIAGHYESSSRTCTTT